MSRSGRAAARYARHLTVAEVAAMLDQRLYDHTAPTEEFLHGCRQAVDAGVASVICRPGTVAAAAAEVTGSPVAVATALGYAPGSSCPPSRDDLVRQAESVLADGAGEVGVLATRPQLAPTARRAFFEDVEAVVRVCHGADALVRVMLMATALSRDDLVAACRLSADAGAGMVQGGVFFADDRATLTQVGIMRQALPASVLLKWTEPVRSLDRLLLARAEGVDRFNADVEALLAEARERYAWGRIVLPVRGRDY